MIFHYKWMVEQMKKRIGLPPSKEINYPIWTWYRWNGVNHRKPDLRYSGHFPKGTKGVFLELKVDSKDVLLSNFDDFNNVLNYGYITNTEVEYDSFYKELESCGYSHSDLYAMDKKSEALSDFRLRLYNSWEKIFDLERDIDEVWYGNKYN